MDFGQALQALDSGRTIRRAGWNGKNMWLAKVTEWNGHVHCANMQMGEDFSWPFSPFIAIFTAKKNLVPWNASQEDVFAKDWEIVD